METCNSGDKSTCSPDCNCKRSCTLKLSVCNLAMSMGFVWGLGAFLVGILSSFGIGIALVRVAGSLYLGFEPSFIGAIAGLVWGFVHGFVLGALIAAFYNCCRCCCPCRSCKESRCCNKEKTCP